MNTTKTNCLTDKYIYVLLECWQNNLFNWLTHDKGICWTKKYRISLVTQIYIYIYTLMFSIVWQHPQYLHKHYTAERPHMTITHERHIWCMFDVQETIWIWDITNYVFEIYTCSFRIYYLNKAKTNYLNDKLLKKTFDADRNLWIY